MALPVYIDVDRYALQYFKGCHNRVRDGKSPSIYWMRDRAGYISFCEEIGPIPTRLEKPSVGRIDHKKGYEPGNIRWEEFKYNSIKRRGTRFENETSEAVPIKVLKFKKGTKEHKDHQKMASNKRWNMDGQKESMSLRMKGNQNARKVKNESISD